jgi:two-component system, sensor histidine kinase
MISTFRRTNENTSIGDARVRTAVVSLLYSNAAVGISMNLISVPLVWFAYRDTANRTALSIALVAWALLQLLSAWNRREWSRLDPAAQAGAEVSSKFLRRARWMAWALATGMACLCAVLHLAATPTAPAFAAAFALVYVLGASISTLIYLPQVRVFSSIVLGSQGLLLLRGAQGAEVLLAVLLFALILGLWTYAKQYSAQLQQVITLRFAVQDLLIEQEKLRNAAEVANQSKSRFFAAASHDVRQPLQAVMLIFHALRHAQTDERRARLLYDAERNLNALRQLFDQVLVISRIEAGAVPVNTQVVALRTLFDRLDARFGGEASARQVWLRFAPTEAFVLSDPDALERMLANLIGNAIKYSNHGGVWVGYRSARGRIEVRDNGLGIAQEHHARLYDEFFQIDNPGRDRASGLGLGLSIVKRLAELLNHPLGFVSAPGKGSTFWLGVRQATKDEMLTFKAPNTGEQRDTAIAANAIDEKLAGLNIWLIENDTQVAFALLDTLRTAGATVEHFASGDTALAAAQNGKNTHCLICDYRLGGPIYGIELVRRLREQWQREVAAILLTGDTAVRELEEFDAVLQNERTVLMHKPVSATALINAINAFRST